MSQDRHPTPIPSIRSKVQVLGKKAKAKNIINSPAIDTLNGDIYYEGKLSPEEAIENLKKNFEPYLQERELSQALDFYVFPDLFLSGSSSERLSFKKYLFGLDNEDGFLKSDFEKEPLLLIQGNAAAGKSLMLYYLAKCIWLAREKPSDLQQQGFKDAEIALLKNYVPFFLNLENLKGESTGLDFIERLVSKHCGIETKDVQALKKEYHFLFLLDGYEKLSGQLKDGNIYRNNRLIEWTGSKIIITCDTQYLVSNYQELFTTKSYNYSTSLVQTYEIAPFNQEQIESYFSKRTFFSNPQAGQIAFSKIKEVRIALEECLNLKRLANSPLFLKIILEVLPEISQKLKESAEQKVTYALDYKGLQKEDFRTLAETIHKYLNVEINFIRSEKKNQDEARIGSNGFCFKKITEVWNNNFYPEISKLSLNGSENENIIIYAFKCFFEAFFSHENTVGNKNNNNIKENYDKKIHSNLLIDCSIFWTDEKLKNSLLEIIFCKNPHDNENGHTLLHYSLLFDEEYFANMLIDTALKNKLDVEKRKLLNLIALSPNAHGRTILHYAVLYKKTEIFKKLFTIEACAYMDNFAATLLFEACFANAVEIFKYIKATVGETIWHKLLARKTEHGWSPLCVAVLRNNKEIIDLILQENKTLNNIVNEIKVAEATTVYLQGNDQPKRISAIKLAIKQKDIETLKRFLEILVDLKELSAQEIAELLFYATSCNPYEKISASILEIITAYFPTPIQRIESFKEKTALHQAVLRRDEEAIRILSKYFSLLCTDKEDSYPIDLLFKNYKENNSRIFQLLDFFAQGKEQLSTNDINKEIIKFQKELSDQSSENYESMLLKFIDFLSTEIKYKSREGISDSNSNLVSVPSMLYYIMMKCAHDVAESIIILLFNHNKNPENIKSLLCGDKKRNRDDTLLHTIIRYQENPKALITEIFSNLNKEQKYELLKLKNKIGATVLAEAACRNDKELIKYLLDCYEILVPDDLMRYVNDPTNNGWTPFLIAVEAENGKVLEYFLDHWDRYGIKINALTNNNESALYFLVNSKKIPADKKISFLKEFIKMDAEIRPTLHTETDTGYDAVHCAIFQYNRDKSSQEILKIFCGLNDFKIDFLTQKNRENSRKVLGYSYLHIAIMCNFSYEQLTELFLLDVDIFSLSEKSKKYPFMFIKQEQSILKQNLKELMIKQLGNAFREKEKISNENLLSYKELLKNYLIRYDAYDTADKTKNVKFIFPFFEKNNQLVYLDDLRQKILIFPSELHLLNDYFPDVENIDEIIYSGRETLQKRRGCKSFLPTWSKACLNCETTEGNIPELLKSYINLVLCYIATGKFDDAFDFLSSIEGRIATILDHDNYKNSLKFLKIRLLVLKEQWLEVKARVEAEYISLSIVDEFKLSLIFFYGLASTNFIEENASTDLNVLNIPRREEEIKEMITQLERNEKKPYFYIARLYRLCGICEYEISNEKINQIKKSENAYENVKNHFMKALVTNSKNNRKYWQKHAPKHYFECELRIISCEIKQLANQFDLTTLATRIHRCHDITTRLKNLLEYTEDVFGKNHYCTSIVLNNLGIVYRQQGDLKNAFIYCKRSKKIRKTHYKLHPRLAMSYIALAKIEYAKRMPIIDIPFRHERNAIATLKKINAKESYSPWWRKMQKSIIKNQKINILLADNETEFGIFYETYILGQDFKEKVHFLHQAIAMNAKKIVEYILIKGGSSKGCDLALMSELEEGKSSGDNKLYLAIEPGKHELFYKVKKFDEKFKINALDANNDDKFISRLMVAIGNGKLNEVSDEDRKTLLSITSKRGHISSKLDLLKYKIRTFNAFHQAVIYNQHSILEFLLFHINDDTLIECLEEKSVEGYSILSIMAYMGYLTATAIIINRIKIIEDDNKIKNILAKLSSIDFGGYTAIDYAILCKHHEIRVLIETAHRENSIPFAAGFPKKNDTINNFDNIIIKDDVEELGSKLKSLSDDVINALFFGQGSNKPYWTPLHKLATRGDLNGCYVILNHLIAYKDKLPTLYTRHGWTPLHAAACSNSEYRNDIVELLLSHCNDWLNMQDIYGESALFIAVKKKYAATIKLLVTKSAAVLLKNNDRITPIDYAAALGMSHIVEILQTELTNHNTGSNNKSSEFFGSQNIFEPFCNYFQKTFIHERYKTYIQVNYHDGDIQAPIENIYEIQNNLIFLTGEPGVGKTTALEQLILMAWKFSCLPLYFKIEPNASKSKYDNILFYGKIYEEEIDICSNADLSKLIEKFNEGNKKLIICLDVSSRITTNIYLIITEIQKLLSAHKNMKFVVGMSLGHEKELSSINKYKTLWLEKFTKAQVLIYTAKYITEKKLQNNKLQKKIDTILLDNEEIFEEFSNPLLLYLFCYTYSTVSDVVYKIKNKYDLYTFLSKNTLILKQHESYYYFLEAKEVLNALGNSKATNLKEVLNKAWDIGLEKLLPFLLSAWQSASVIRKGRLEGSIANFYSKIKEKSLQNRLSIIELAIKGYVTNIEITSDNQLLSVIKVRNTIFDRVQFKSLKDAEKDESIASIDRHIFFKKAPNIIPRLPDSSSNSPPTDALSKKLRNYENYQNEVFAFIKANPIILNNTIYYLSYENNMLNLYRVKLPKAKKILAELKIENPDKVETLISYDSVKANNKIFFIFINKKLFVIRKNSVQARVKYKFREVTPSLTEYNFPEDKILCRQVTTINDIAYIIICNKKSNFYCIKVNVTNWSLEGVFKININIGFDNDAYYKKFNESNNSNEITAICNTRNSNQDSNTIEFIIAYENSDVISYKVHVQEDQSLMQSHQYKIFNFGKTFNIIHHFTCSEEEIILAATGYPDDNQIYAYNRTKKIYHKIFFDTKEKQIIGISSDKISQEKTYFMSYSHNGNFAFWDYADKKFLGNCFCHDLNSILGAFLLCNANSFFIFSWTKCSWSSLPLTADLPVIPLFQHQTWILCLAILDGKILSADREGKILFWDITASKCINSLKVTQHGIQPIYTMDTTKNNNYWYLIAANKSGLISLFKVEKEANKYSFLLEGTHSLPVVQYDEQVFIRSIHFTANDFSGKGNLIFICIAYSSDIYIGKFNIIGKKFDIQYIFGKQSCNLFIPGYCFGIYEDQICFIKQDKVDQNKLCYYDYNHKRYEAEAIISKHMSADDNVFSVFSWRKYTFLGLKSGCILRASPKHSAKGIIIDCILKKSNSPIYALAIASSFIENINFFAYTKGETIILQALDVIKVTACDSLGGQNLTAHRGEIYDLKFFSSHTATYLASAGSDSNIVVWKKASISNDWHCIWMSNLQRTIIVSSPTNNTIVNKNFINPEVFNKKYILLYKKKLSHHLDKTFNRKLAILIATEPDTFQYEYPMFNTHRQAEDALCKLIAKNFNLNVANKKIAVALLRPGEAFLLGIKCKNNNFFNTVRNGEFDKTITFSLDVYYFWMHKMGIGTFFAPIFSQALHTVLVKNAGNFAAQSDIRSYYEKGDFHTLIKYFEKNNAGKLSYGYRMSTGKQRIDYLGKIRTYNTESEKNGFLSEAVEKKMLSKSKNELDINPDDLFYYLNSLIKIGCAFDVVKFFETNSVFQRKEHGSNKENCKLKFLYASALRKIGVSKLASCYLHNAIKTEFIDENILNIKFPNKLKIYLWSIYLNSKIDEYSMLTSAEKGKLEQLNAALIEAIIPLKSENVNEYLYYLTYIGHYHLTKYMRSRSENNIQNKSFDHKNLSYFRKKIWKKFCYYHQNATIPNININTIRVLAFYLFAHIQASDLFKIKHGGNELLSLTRQIQEIISANFEAFYSDAAFEISIIKWVLECNNNANNKAVRLKLTYDLCDFISKYKNSLGNKLSFFDVMVIDDPAVQLVVSVLCDLDLMSKLEGEKSSEDNKLYLAIEAGKHQLFYKVKKFDEKFKINASDANNDEKFISRLMLAIGNGKLNQVSDEDRKTLLSITSKRGHTPSVDEILIVSIISKYLSCISSSSEDYYNHVKSLLEQMPICDKQERNDKKDLQNFLTNAINVPDDMVVDNTKKYNDVELIRYHTLMVYNLLVDRTKEEDVDDSYRRYSSKILENSVDENGIYGKNSVYHFPGFDPYFDLKDYHLFLVEPVKTLYNEENQTVRDKIKQRFNLIFNDTGFSKPLFANYDDKFCHHRVLFQCHNEELHWGIAELCIQRNERNYQIWLEFHNPYGGDLFDENTQAVFISYVKGLIIERTSPVKLEITLHISSSRYASSRLFFQDKESSVVVAAHELIMRIMNESLDKAAPYLPGAVALRQHAYAKFQIFNTQHKEINANTMNFFNWDEQDAIAHIKKHKHRIQTSFSTGNNSDSISATTFYSTSMTKSGDIFLSSRIMPTTTAATTAISSTDFVEEVAAATTGISATETVSKIHGGLTKSALKNDLKQDTTLINDKFKSKSKTEQIIHLLFSLENEDLREHIINTLQNHFLEREFSLYSTLVSTALLQYPTQLASKGELLSDADQKNINAITTSLCAQQGQLKVDIHFIKALVQKLIHKLSEKQELTLAPMRAEIKDKMQALGDAQTGTLRAEKLADIEQESIEKLKKEMFNKAVGGKKSLSTVKSKEDLLKLKNMIGNNFRIGSAMDNGDCFFDALAQVVNQIRSKKYNAKELRKICYDARNEKIIFHKKNQQQEEKTVKQLHEEDYPKDTDKAKIPNYERIKLLQSDCKDGKPCIFGRGHVEGILLCQKLKLDAIVIKEIRFGEVENNRELIGTEHYYTATGVLSPEEFEKTQVSVNKKNRVTLLVEAPDNNSGLHFVPLLKETKIDSETSESENSEEEEKPVVASLTPSTPTMGPSQQQKEGRADFFSSPLSQSFPPPTPLTAGAPFDSLKPKQLEAAVKEEILRIGIGNNNEVREWLGDKPQLEVCSSGAISFRKVDTTKFTYDTSVIGKEKVLDAKYETEKQGKERFSLQAKQFVENLKRHEDSNGDVEYTAKKIYNKNWHYYEYGFVVSPQTVQKILKLVERKAAATATKALKPSQ